MPPRETGPMLDGSDGAPPMAAVCARALGDTLARHGGELARVADGGTVTGDTIAAAATIAALAVELLTNAPLLPWWQGYTANVGDAVDGLLDLSSAARSGTAAPTLAPAGRPSEPLDGAADRTDDGTP